MEGAAGDTRRACRSGRRGSADPAKARRCAVVAQMVAMGRSRRGGGDRRRPGAESFAQTVNSTRASSRFVDFGVFEEHVKRTRGRADETGPAVEEIALDQVLAQEEQRRIEHHAQSDETFAARQLVDNEAGRIRVDL